MYPIFGGTIPYLRKEDNPDNYYSCRIKVVLLDQIAEGSGKYIR